MNPITVFRFNSNNTVQTITVDGIPYLNVKMWLQSQIIQILKKALLYHVDNEDKQTLKQLKGSNKLLHLDYNAQNTTYINGPGLYSLIIRNKKAEAKVFKRWVCGVVLPSILKTGSYTIEDNEEKAKRIVNNPEEERALQYNVVRHIKIHLLR